MTTPDLTDAQLARIRETIRATIEEWRLSYRIPHHKTHDDLECLLVGAVYAMHQGGVLVVQPINQGKPVGAEGGV